MDNNNNFNKSSSKLNYQLIKEERLPTGEYCYFHEAHKLETHYTYKNIDTGEVFTTKQKIHNS
jgi:hypothetical protein